METNPYREPSALAGLRFALEVLAWVTIYFAFGWPFMILALALLALLNVPGDKHRVIVPIPGKLRIVLEIAVFVAGGIAIYRVWSFPSVSIYSLVVAIMFVSSHRRMRFLWQH
ncbi:MAG: hypothetical protein ACT4O1_09015 [Gemmatimonadota bacterium]